MTTFELHEPLPDVRIQHPAWCRDAAIYQINTRQFTPEGTLRAAQQELPRLRELGVGILWLMPVQEIGEQNRKGVLGSPYAVKDYYKVSPELGTLADLQQFVAAAHDLGLHVILDWVANHTAWDNPLTIEHPDWYSRDWQGRFRPTPWWDWDDIIDLDYAVPAMRRYMADAMRYWVEQTGIDGYRCDTAGFVPTDFWNAVRRELDRIKPVFMLAEWESRDLHAEAFDMTYAWSWNETMHRIAAGETDLAPLRVYYSWNEKSFPADSIRMTFVSNHDMNAWEGTEFERFGAALEATTVLSVVGEGMPLIYNGQEAGNDRRLAFFDRDPIDWRPHPMGDLYRRLFALKHANSALWNARWGARMIAVGNTDQDRVFSFVRRNEQDKVFAVFNFSDAQRSVTFVGGLCLGSYQDFDTGEAVTIGADPELTLPPWGYRVLVQ